jgi:hypothetical protein
MNKPAFPSEHSNGMTLRDYFAAQALQGMLASGNLPKTMPDADLADCVYNLADAMLEARDA